MQVKDSTFTQFEFTPEEELAAQVFPSLNAAWIQNQLALAAEERMDLVFDPLNPLAAGLADAYLRGQVDICKFLLGISKDRKTDLQAHLEEVAASQRTDGTIVPLSASQLQDKQT